jgi:outer membrane protein TolC
MKPVFSPKLIFFIIFFPLLSLAQNKPAGNAPLLTQNDSANEAVIRQKLAALALNNVSFNIADKQIEISRYNLQKTKAQLWNNVSISGNLNEFTIPGASNNQATLFPRYNIGAIIPLGMFGVNSKDKKIARENIAVTQLQRKSLENEVKTTVLKLYEDYLMYKKQVELQSQLAADEYAAVLKAEKDYQDGTVEIDAYNDAYKRYNEALSRKVALQRNLNITIIDIENYIGVSLQDVISGKI